MKKILLAIVFLTSLNAGNLGELLSSLNQANLINAQENLSKSVEEKAKSVKLAYLPKVKLQGNYVAFSYDKYAISPNNVVGINLAIEALLYDGSRSSNIKLIMGKSQISKLELEKLKLDLELKLSKIYFSYFALEDSIKYKEEQINHLKAALNKLEKLYKVGLKPLDELEILRANVELKTSELENLKYKLEELLSNIYIITKKHIIPQKSSFIILDNEEENKNIDYKIQNLKQELAGYKKDLSQANFMPKIFASDLIGLSKNNYDFSVYRPFDAIVKERVKDKMFSNIFIIGFTWDVFNFNADKKNYESAKLEELAAKNLANYEKNKNTEEIKLKEIKLKNTANNIAANEKILKASKIAFDSIDKKYQAGLLDYVEYLNALENVYAAKASLSLAKAQEEIEKSELLVLKGIKISSKIGNL